ncbi:MAG: 5'/3'-nucleotidase SurE, partial [Planctomycetota bacterium]
ALHGLRAVAASQYRGRDAVIDWERAAAWLAPVVASVLAAPQRAGEFWNVNLPSVAPAGRTPEAVECPVDPSPFALEFRDSPEGFHWAADYHRRPRLPRHDVEVCFGGDISVSRLRVT